MEIKKSNKANLENKRIIFIEIGLIVSLALIISAFEYETYLDNSADRFMKIENTEETIIEVARTYVNTPPPPKVWQLSVQKKDEEIKEEFEMENMEANSKTKIDFKSIKVEEDPRIDEPDIIYNPEIMPKFDVKPYLSFSDYIAKNLIYPSIAIENNISGRVFIQFTINEKGEVINAKVIKSDHKCLNEEALRIVSTSPRWIPGMQGNKPVKVLYTCQIRFDLQ
jgi:protein TonB